MTWCSSRPPRRQWRRSRPEVASPPVASSTVSEPAAVWTPTGQAPPRTAMSPPALTRQGPAAERSSAARSAAQPLPMPPKSRRTPASSSMRRPVTVTPPPHAAGAGFGPVGRDLVERAVVAGRDDGVVDGRIEPTAGELARGEREAGQGDELRAGVCRAGLVEPAQLRLGQEARQDRLQPVELGLGRVERAGGVCGVDEQLDVGAHRPEGAPLHHDVLVTVSGGRLTTRTAGAAA